MIACKLSQIDGNFSKYFLENQASLAACIDVVIWLKRGVGDFLFLKIYLAILIRYHISFDLEKSVSLYLNFHQLMRVHPVGTFFYKIPVKMRIARRAIRFKLPAQKVSQPIRML